MSKFTKALEKIQGQKEKKTAGGEKAKPTFHVPAEYEERMQYWDRGISSVKNAKPDTKIVTYHFPNSLISEQFRMFRTNLKTRLAQEQAKVILISSSVHAEGKTVTATNLAVSLAEMENCKVALVDADLRRGRVADYLGLGKNLIGLANLLSEEINLKQAFVKNSLENLYVIPRGKMVTNPSELVESEKFRILIAELRKHFDYVIIDSPPIMSVADANILGRETDGMVMVIQSGKTPKNVIAQAHNLFKQGGIKLLGYVLTHVEYQSADTRYYYHQYYHSEVDQRKRMREWIRHYLHVASDNFRKGEERFNLWWEKKVLKK